MKWFINKLLPYLVVAGVSVGVTFLCHVYAQAHRADPRLWGGEVVLGVSIFFGYVIARIIHKERQLNK